MEFYNDCCIRINKDRNKRIQMTAAHEDHSKMMLPPWARIFFSLSLKAERNSSSFRYLRRSLRAWAWRFRRCSKSRLWFPTRWAWHGVNPQSA